MTEVKILLAMVLGGLALILHGCGGSQCVNMPKGQYTQHCVSSTCGCPTQNDQSVVFDDRNTLDNAGPPTFSQDLCSQTTFRDPVTTIEIVCDTDAHNCTETDTMHTVDPCVTHYTLTWCGQGFCP